MSQTYAQFINNPKKATAEYDTFSENLATLMECEKIRGDLDQLTKKELKEMVMMHIAAGAMFAAKRDALDGENARLRRSNMEKSRELDSLRLILGYD